MSDYNGAIVRFMKVSIIVPVYNNEKYIDRCLKAIQNQTYKNIECLCIDDGSTDSSSQICQQYVKRDNRFRLITLSNHGVSYARNVGLEQSTGDFIMFCDSDDYVSEKWVEVMAGAMIHNRESWIVSGFERMGNNKIDKFPFPGGEDIVYMDMEEYYQVFLRGCSPYIWNKIYLKSRIEQLDLKFNTTIGNGEDIDFNIKYCSGLRHIVGINQVLYYYNCSNINSITNRYDPELFCTYKFAYDVRKELIAEKYKTSYDAYWFPVFYSTLENTFLNTEISFWGKLARNNRIVHDPCFINALHNSGLGKKDKSIRLLEICHNYIFYYLLMKFVRFLKRKKVF